MGTTGGYMIGEKRYKMMDAHFEQNYYRMYILFALITPFSKNDRLEVLSLFDLTNSDNMLVSHSLDRQFNRTFILVMIFMNHDSPWGELMMP